MTTEPKWSDFASRDTGRTLAAANGLLPAWVSLVIVVIIGWQLAKIIWMFVPGADAGGRVLIPAGQGQGQSSTGASSADVDSIAAAHMFGQADAADVAPIAVPEDDVPDTAKNLVLRGTHAAEDQDTSVAIISDGTQDERVYNIGDAVASGTTLHAVYADKVIFNENGELTQLSLPRDYEQSAPRQIRRTTPTRQTNTASIQSVVAKNVSRLADVIRPTPYFQNGQQQGYRVYPGRDRQKFSALGLRPGDLIKEIDGQSLSDPTQAMQIFQSLGTASEVTVTVERNGTPETLVLKTDQLDIGKDQTE